MAHVEGLHLREARYSLRIVIPKDLKKAFGKDRVNIALGTSDRREATFKATLLRAEWLASFESKRRELAPAKVAAVTPELANHLAERIRARVLRGDDDARQDFGLLEDLARATAPPSSALTIPTGTPPRAALTPPKRDPLAGVSPAEAQALEGLNEFMDKQAGLAYSRRNLATVLPWVQHEAKLLGISFDLDTPGVLEALPVCLAAYRKARQDVTARDAGHVIPTPDPQPLESLQPPKPPERPKTLRDVYDRWTNSGAAPRSADSIAAYRRTVEQFERQHPGKTLSDFNGDLGDQYRAWLLEDCNTPKTARDRLTAIKSLLKYATETLEWLPKQPWHGLDIKAPTTNKRRPWSTAELQLVFGSPLFQQGTLPAHNFSGREAAYWVPLLGLFTGARLGELCQLRTVDIQELEGIPVLVLTDEGEGQSIKSEAGHRSVPIHSELIRLGFLAYVETVRASGSDSLWPAMRIREGKPSDFFGRWFKDHRHSLGLTDSRPDFHCFRHTVRPLMRQAGFSEETQDKVTGHKARGSVGSVVYGHWTLPEIRAAVEAIKYPALSLPKVDL